ncbi:MAG: hypothetical protein ACXWRA_01140 [Pseudobdellovibrionaceae bacterium]
MKWSKIITSYLVVLQLVMAPLLSHAQVDEVDLNKNGQLTKSGKEKVKTYYDFAKEKQLEGHVDLPNKRMLIINPADKKVMFEFPLSDEQALMEYSPKNLNQKLMAEMVRVKSANAGAWSRATREFLPQSTMFFFVLGAMIALQLLTDYADDPVGMKHHIDNQLSVVGQFAFYMFMYSQGATSNILGLWLKNPNLEIPVAMLGMTVGSAIQTYISQVAADPHIRNCSAAIFKGEKIEGNDHPCEGAYKYFVLDKKILEAPGAIALLGAFAISTTGQVVIGSALKLVGFNIGLWLTPEGMAIKVVSLISQAANIAAFTQIQEIIQPYIETFWKNYYDGREFVDINDKIVAFIESQKASHWKADAKDFNRNLKAFSEKMSAWRVTNLSEAYKANQSWVEFLNNLTSMYTASYGFYSTYLDHLNTNRNSYIDLQYPLFGVSPKGLVPGHEDLFLEQPMQIQRWQGETTKDVADWIKQIIDSGYYRKIGFAKWQQDIISSIQQGLASEDILTKSKALTELNEALSKYSIIENPGPSFGKGLREALPIFGEIGSLFARELRRIYSALGTPKPMLEKGRGFAASILLSPSLIGTFRGAKPDETNGHFKTSNIADYLIVQMMCGPDPLKGENVVSVFKGFPAKFNAPTVTLDAVAKKDLCTGAPLTRVSGDRLYDLPFSNYRTAPEFLRANMNPKIAEDFVSWWKKGTEAHMKVAFKVFSHSYLDVMNKLYKGLNQSKRNPWNRGPISNGAIPAAFQEVRLYSLILGELLKDSYKDQYKRDLPASYYNTKPDSVPTKPTIEEITMSKKPLLALLGHGSTYDFNALMGVTKSTTESHSLQFQKDFELLFSQMDDLVQSAQTHSVKSEEYQNKMKEIEEKLSEVGELFGVKKNDSSIFALVEQLKGNQNSETKNPQVSFLADAIKVPDLNSLVKTKVSNPLPGLINMSPNQGMLTLGNDQKALAVTCLELLQSVANELSMLGAMAATASFSEKE